MRTADHSCVRHSDKLEREESMTFKLCCRNHQEGPQKDTSHLRWISLRYQNYNDGQRGGNLWALLRRLSDLDRQVLDQSGLATWPCGVKRGRFFSQRICWLMNGFPFNPQEVTRIDSQRCFECLLEVNLLSLSEMRTKELTITLAIFILSESWERVYFSFNFLISTKI